MKTTIPQDPGASREWLLVDAAGKPLGRLAVAIANVLRGRDKPTWMPSADTGAFVVVTNAGKVKLTGKKDTWKTYQRYSGWRGGRRVISAEVMRARHPDRMITLAVRGMLPNNNLATRMMRRLRVYAGNEHPHAAQQPKAVELI
ncbi:MAG: 50S ribosomal protein L13 [Kiritimatiellia bacterium]|jgi:large subunit ribosomal protein L13